MHNSDGCFVCCDLFVSFCNWFRSLAIKSKSKTEYIRQLKSGKLKCAWMCTRSRQQSIEHVKIESAWFGRWIRIYGWLCMLGSDPVCVVFFFTDLSLFCLLDFGNCNSSSSGGDDESGSTTYTVYCHTATVVVQWAVRAYNVWIIFRSFHLTCSFRDFISPFFRLSLGSATLFSVRVYS